MKYALIIMLLAVSIAMATDTQPSSNMDYWLEQAKPAAKSQPATGPAGGTNPFVSSSGFLRNDAIPGVIELSDGRQLPGGIFTTRDKPWIVWVASEKRWRHIPPLSVLAIKAKVVQQHMELVWRWKAMGVPEKVYTGESYPFRRFLWEFTLADGSTITGAVKGQPVWVENAKTHNKTGPFLMAERSKGKPGQSLDDLVYINQIVLSKKMMAAVTKDHAKLPTATSKSAEKE